MKLVRHGNDVWEVLSLGARLDGGSGLVFAHLRNTQRFTSCANGKHWVQIADWIDPADIIEVK